jgi:cell division septum initiation protein DivIVA
VIDSGMKGRVIGMLAGTPLVRDIAEQTDGRPVGPSEADAQRQALQVLNLAQRTAEDHLANAHRQADKICAEARATAEQIVRDAEARAGDLRWQADKALAEARATAEQIGREARAHTEDVRRNADKILGDARARAEEIAIDARAKADDLKHQAQQRYQDVVGSLADKREALQDQIEALENFDRQYRTQITTFLQSQLRALWVDEPKVSGELEAAALPLEAGNTDDDQP